MLPREIQGDEQANRIKSAFFQGLGDNRFFPDGGKIGFPCHHLYTNTEVFPGQKDSSEPLSYKQINKLKGRDLMIANAAVDAGLSIFTSSRILSMIIAVMVVERLYPQEVPKEETLPSIHE